MTNSTSLCIADENVDSWLHDENLHEILGCEVRAGTDATNLRLLPELQRITVGVELLNLAETLGSLQKLEDLLLIGPWVTDGLVAQVVERVPTLNQLTVSAPHRRISIPTQVPNFALSRASLRGLQAGPRNTRRLTLSRCRLALTNVKRALDENDLASMEIVLCTGISKEELLALADAYPKIQWRIAALDADTPDRWIRKDF